MAWRLDHLGLGNPDSTARHRRQGATPRATCRPDSIAAALPSTDVGVTTGFAAISDITDDAQLVLGHSANLV